MNNCSTTNKNLKYIIPCLNTSKLSILKQLFHIIEPNYPFADEP